MQSRCEFHSKCEWVTPRDDSEWINDDYIDHLGTVDGVGDRIGWMNPDNHSLRDLVADLKNIIVFRGIRIASTSLVSLVEN